ncbi:MAG: hypothetical protein FWD86_00005 [Firmicutes bacterium]|nr:hypothetical protein [Bacillota bacterium]
MIGLIRIGKLQSCEQATRLPLDYKPHLCTANDCKNCDLQRSFAVSLNLTMILNHILKQNVKSKVGAFAFFINNGF